MLLRQAMPTGVPGRQPWVGLTGVLLFATATVWAASRIFRVAILMQGKPPRLGEMMRWAMKGWAPPGLENALVVNWKVVDSKDRTDGWPSG
jgi:hypothetical protein